MFLEAIAPQRFRGSSAPAVFANRICPFGDHFTKVIFPIIVRVNKCRKAFKTVQKGGSGMNPEVVKTYPFIDTWRASGYQYYIIPKSMLTAGKDFGLGIDEAMLYAVLRARTSLSIKNNWIDAATGRVYIIYKRETAAEYFNWSRKKAGEVFKRLVDAGLLKEEEQPADNLAKKRMLKQPKRLFLSQWAEPSVLTSVETLKNGGFLPITRQSLDTPDGYYIIPYSFFEDEALEGLKLRSILLYAILLDKLHLSMKYGQIGRAHV